MKAIVKKNFFAFQRRLLLALILLFWFAQMQGQISDVKFSRFSTENIKVEKGLSQTTVNAITQDKKGYIWIGTWDGLNKFDGYNYTVYRPGALGEKNTLSSETVNCLLVDKQGTLWVGTERGLNRFERSTGDFISYLNDEKDPASLSGNNITCIFQDRNKNLWIGTTRGLNRMDRASGKFTRYTLNKNNKGSIGNNRINAIYEDKLGFLWVCTNKGINQYNPLSETFKVYSKINSGLVSDTVNSITQDKEGVFWIATERGLCKADAACNVMKVYLQEDGKSGKISSSQVKIAFCDSRNNLWFATASQGLNLYNRAKDNFIVYRNTPTEPYSIGDNGINTLFEDQDGDLWIGTNKGMSKVEGRLSTFYLYRNIPNEQESLNNNIVWGLMSDAQGKLWIATDGGVNIYNPNDRTYSFLVNTPGCKNCLPSNSIRTVLIDKSGIAWIGTYDEGLCSYNPTTKIVTTYKSKPDDKNTLSSNSIWCILDDGKGNLWLSTWGGLDLFEKKTGKVTRFSFIKSTTGSQSANVLFQLAMDKDGYIWTTSYDGISRFDPNSRTFIQYKNIPGRNSLSNNRAFCILIDEQGIIWVGTGGGGLNRFDPKTGRFKIYTEANGLGNNLINAILDDHQGNLWMSTNDGISRFNKATETFINYDIKDGLQGREFNVGSYYQSPKNEMFFGGMNGLNSFFPSEIKRNMHVPPIEITSFKVFNKVVKTEFENGDTIRLNYTDNFFTIEFAALDYANPYKNSYSYRLENFDKRWIFVDANKRSAEYTDVSPGTYTFWVKGSNNDGVWNEKGVKLTIIIKPPWWKTWAFRIGLSVFIVFLGWLIVYLQVRRSRKKHELQRKMLEIERNVFDLEQKSLRLQMNPHFIFNSLNSIQSFIINNDTDKATRYLAKFAQLMRLILTNSREAFVSVKDEVKTLTHYLDIEKLRFDNKFDYIIQVDPAIDDDFVGVPPMILQPYVENAILHGIIHLKERGKIIITLTQKHEIIQAIVEDNGIGRERAMKIKNESGLHHQSRGMNITRERLEILGRQTNQEINVAVIDLIDDLGSPAGTRVEINLPYREI